MLAAPAAIPPKPNTAATKAMMKKLNAQPNMPGRLCSGCAKFVCRTTLGSR